MNFFKIIMSFLRDEHYRELLFISGTAVITGTIVFHLLEGWTWLDSLYFSLVTLTTVGYGDFSPQTSEGKIFAMIYIVVGVGIILNFIQVIFDHFKEERQIIKNNKEEK